MDWQMCTFAVCMNSLQLTKGFVVIISNHIIFRASLIQLLLALHLAGEW